MEGETVDETDNPSITEVPVKNVLEKITSNIATEQPALPQPHEESDEASSVSTLSTIQHITPMATPTKGQSKRTTPRSRYFCLMTYLTFVIELNSI